MATTLADRVAARLQERKPDAAEQPSRPELLRRVERDFQDALREEVRGGMQAVSRSLGPHENYIWEAAARWILPEGSDDTDFVVPYLAAYGYDAENGEEWRAVEQNPVLHLGMESSGDSPSHEEHGGHTWYKIVCRLSGIPDARLTVSGPVPELGIRNILLVTGGADCLGWTAPRRLLQLRQCLHDPVKVHLGASYAGHFSETPFAKFGGFRGTTARLSAWLAKLTELINMGALSPTLVARVLAFFRGPPQECQDAPENLIDMVGVGPEGTDYAGDPSGGELGAAAAVSAEGLGAAEANLAEEPDAEEVGAEELAAMGLSLAEDGTPEEDAAAAPRDVGEVRGI